MTNEAATCTCEDCIDEDLNEDAKLIARFKRLGFWVVIEDGLPKWGHA
jgi:hypothetical protein